MSLRTKLLRGFYLNLESKAYWLKITSKVPHCIYYFGPFGSAEEAWSLQSGYIQDLLEEQARGIHVELEQRNCPEALTICDEKDY